MFYLSSACYAGQGGSENDRQRHEKNICSTDGVS